MPSSVTAAACTVFALSLRKHVFLRVAREVLRHLAVGASTRRKPLSHPTNDMRPASPNTRQARSSTCQRFDAERQVSRLCLRRRRTDSEFVAVVDHPALAVGGRPPNRSAISASARASSVTVGDPAGGKMTASSPAWNAVQPPAAQAATRYWPVTTRPSARWITVSRRLPESSQMEAMALRLSGRAAMVAI